MRTTPSTLWPYLLSQGLRPVEVYEIDPLNTLDAIERLGNNDFETWASGSDLSGWSEFPTTGTIAKDTVNMRTGTACVKMTSGGGGEAIERYDLHFPVGAWINLEVWVKSTVAKANGYALRIVNLTTVRELKTDMTWSAGNTGLRAQAGTLLGGGVWQRFVIQFRTEDAAGAADNYAISLQQYSGAGWSAGDDMWIDSASVKGGYERPTLYFSDQDVSWNGNDYLGRVTQRTAIEESMELEVPSFTMTLSNVSNALRSYLYPTDTLTGARVHLRILGRDASGVFIAESLERFVGVIEPPSRISETDFLLSVVGLIDGGGKELPVRRFQMPCAWQYANRGRFDGAGHCPYTQSRTANGAGAASTSLTLTPIPHTFEAGDYIQIAGGAEVLVVAGAPTTAITLATPQTWANGAGVRFSRCDRSRRACKKHELLHRYGGFPAAAIIARLASAAHNTELHGPGPQLRATGSEFSDPTVPVPLLYGRRRVSPRRIEVKTSTMADGSTLTTFSFYAWSEGPVDDNGGSLRYFVDNVLEVDVITSGEKSFGIYYRVGGQGVNDTETQAEYLADPTTQLRAQNIDFRSVAGVSYSELANIILILMRDIQVAGVPSTPRSFSSFEIDGNGLKVASYDSAGAPIAAAWSNLAPWQFLDLCMSDKHGLALASTDFDLPMFRDSADYASPLIQATEASTKIRVAQGSATKVCKIDSAEGFVAGRRVDINGVANTVESVVADAEIRLGTAVTQTVGHTVVQRPSRFESHLYLARSDKAVNWLKKFLISCRGYITYDAGKIQFRIERDTVKERLLNGDFELWSSSTNADSWTETIPAGVTVARDATIKSGGLYSARIDRTDAVPFGGLLQNISGLEPGRWYRIVFKHQQDALGIGTACRLFILNITKNLYLDADGVTWGTSRRVIDKEGSTVFTEYEATFKFREDFATTDAVEIALTPNFTAGHSVWYDDVHLRGPYAGDFREFTTPLLMGWKEGSFVWGIDKKDRETNRVAVQFINESANFGTDEAAADDFTHQLTHQIKTLEVTCEAIADRDQAKRIADFILAKKRQLGPGSEFLGTPAALALQPGDVILVSDTVPGWACKEQRVIGTKVLGLPDPDEGFVTVQTEDYLESIYSDVGPTQGDLPVRPTPVITVTVSRHTGGILDLSWAADASLESALYFRIHSSPTAGFTPGISNLVGQTTSTQFSYTPPVEQIEQLRYYRVVAVTDYGGIQSAEFSATIFAVDYDATDGTHGENNADGNMIYDSDFQGTEFQDGTTKNGDGWLTNTNVTYTDRDANSNVTPSGTYAANGSDIAATTPANAYDNNLTTYAVLIGTWINISSADNIASARYGFAAGTRTGRGKIRGKVGGSGFGLIQLFYSVSGSGGPWILLASPTGTADADYFTPRLTAQNMANFFVEIRAYPRMSGSNNTASFSIAEIDFQEETAGAVVAHIVDGHLELKGDGTNYAEGRRRFPGKTPPATGTYLTTTTPNRWEIKAQRLVAGSAPTNPLEIRFEDALTGRVWAVASIAAADIGAGWAPFTALFDPGAFPVSGSLDIVIRTKDANGIRCDQVLLARQLVITQYQVSSEDQQLGRFPDLRIGESVNWPKGKLTVAGGYRKGSVA